jgi:HK97 family phage portal protein
MTDGNAYGLVTGYGANTWPTSVDIIDPSSVQWRNIGGEWVTAINNKPINRWPLGPLWHVPLFTMPGAPYGQSPVAAAKETISSGMSAERFGADFFTKGGNPNAIIYSESQLSKEQAEGIKEAFVSATSGSREPAVMGAGLKYERVQINPQEAQFLDSQRFTVEQIARIYGVPPEMIGGATSGQAVTYANREQRAADWLTFGFMPYLVPLEAALTALLPRPQRVKFNVDAVLRSDLKTRYESYQIGIGAKFLTPNEARSLEDLLPVDGGDTFPEPPPAPMPPAADPNGPPA